MRTANDSPIDRALLSGIAWTAILRWGAQLVSWVATFYAVRLLVPADYGLVSMAMVAIGMARMVEDFGMDAILVQDRSVVGQAESRLAGFLLGVSFTLCGLFILLAHPVAAFFREPKIETIIRVFSLLFVLDALQVVPRARLQRELRFQALAVVTFVQVAATSIILVASVRTGLGHWSLVLNTLGGAIVTTAVLFVWCPYKIAWPSDLRKISTPLLQGWRILASRAAWYGYSNADQTIIGRFLGKDALGAYSFAQTLSSLSIQEVGAIFSRVVPGIFSQLQDSIPLLRRYFLLLTQLLAVITFPMAIGLVVTADLFVPLLLGPEWVSVIVPLRLLSLYTAYLSSQLLTSHVLMWTGQFRINMWCAILTGIAMPLAFLVTIGGGLQGIGWAWLLVFPIVNAPSLVFAFRTIEISVWQWLDSLKPALSGCAAMCIAVAAVRTALPASLPLVAITAVSVLAGAVVYFAVIWFGFRKRVDTMLNLARAVRGRAPVSEKAVSGVIPGNVVDVIEP
jgi:teichuronic acid exporter